MEPLDQKLTELTTDITTFQAKAKEDLKNFGTVQTETKNALDTAVSQLGKLQTQVDAIDLKMATRHVESATQQKSLGDLVGENEKFLEAKEHGFAGKRPVTIHLKSSAFERKANITEGALGSGTGGVVSRVMLSGPIPLSMQGFRIRDLIAVRPLTTGNAFDWIRQTVRTNLASPQVEALAKSESTYSWDVQSGTVKTIAHFVNVSRQALDDVPWLRETIDGELKYGLLLKEETEILSGDGTGEHLNGIITQATAYSTAYDNVSSYTRLDQLRHAKLQARLAGLATYSPDAFVLHPTDMAEIELIKDESGGVAHKGRYIIGDPKTGTELKFVWGLPVVESDSITPGTFLTGSFARAAELVDRMAATVEISFEHASNFTSNLATVLCEERVGLAVKKPGAFIKGTFASSPA